MNRTIYRLTGMFFAFAIGGSAMAGSGGSCDPVEGIVSICGLERPEDLVTAPNGRDIIFGQFAQDGNISLLDTRDDSVHLLFPGSDSTITSGELWGDPACQSPSDSFQAHGIDLYQRRDGRWQLLVVNHGGRESVEFFELVAVDENRPRLIWRGCAVGPDQANFNDVAALPDGGFMVTHMADKDRQMWQLFLSFFGVDSGFVYRWDQARGFFPVPGTEGKMPNGIILSPDGKSYFLNVYFSNELRKYDLASGKLLAQVEIEKPDNLSWTPQGKLLVASQHSSVMDLLGSLNQDGADPSLLPFSILEVDPDTLQSRVLLRREGRPMGAGTVGVEVDGYLYIGSYVGDRMIKIAVPTGE